MELVERIENFLNESTEHAIAVSKGDARLSKSTGRKFLFSLSDINSLYGSVNSFINQLPVSGFTGEVTIDLHKLRPDRKSYKIDTLMINFKPKDLSAAEGLPQTSQIVPAPAAALPTSMAAPVSYPAGLGYTPVLHTDWIQSKVIEERYRDLQRDNDDLREQNKDLRSQVRTLNEEKASLRLQLDTADKKHELQLKEELLNKKGFYESPAFEKITDAMGAILPIVAERYMGGSAAAAATPALAAADLSPVKREFLNIISQPSVTDEQINALYTYLNALQNETAIPQ